MTSKVALVTGGAQGLGAATAIVLARRGCRIAVADIDDAGSLRTAGSCDRQQSMPPESARALNISVDLATDDGPARMVEETLRRFERLDVLINCAAYAPVESFLAMTARSWQSALLINVRAIALGMSAAARVMMTQGSGHIINVTSAAARMALPNFSAYAATKAAVDALTRAGAAALGSYGIRVNGFSPGMMDTPMQEQIEAEFARLENASSAASFKAERTARVPLKRRTTAEEMAESLAWLALDSPAYMTAERLNVTGGLDKD
jgi:3-oxoacyl-[acyl-carrier protein] reductase